MYPWRWILFIVQRYLSTLSQGFKDDNLGNSPGWWAATAGLLGFVETNAFLALKAFAGLSSDMSHGVFKKELTHALLFNRFDLENSNVLTLRPKLGSIHDTEHKLQKVGNKKQKCYSCSNRGAIRVQRLTIWCCCCDPTKPLCSPNTGRDCFTEHTKTGLFSEKQYRRSRSGTGSSA